MNEREVDEPTDRSDPAESTAETLSPSQFIRGEGVSTGRRGPMSGTAMARASVGIPAGSSVGTPGRRFGNFQLIEPIGETGGMGVVYRANQIDPPRAVALKRIKKGLEASEEQLERFRIEIEAVAQFDHPNIIRVLESGEYDGELFYSMPLVEGGSLHHRLRNEAPLPSLDTARIMRAISDAIAYAHQRHVIHRDLKPANIVFDTSENPLVIDFGIAKRLDDSSGRTATGDWLGTWSYMPPEQVKEPSKVDETADIFSIGAVMYECLTGRPPYHASNPVETIKLLGNAKFEPVTPRRVNPEVHQDLEAICLKCIEKDPRQRYRSAQQLTDDLDRFLSGEAPSVRPLTPTRRLAIWCARNRLAATSLVLTAVLGCCLLGVLIVDNQHLQDLNEKLGINADRLEETHSDLKQSNKQLDRTTRFAKESVYLNRISEVNRLLNEHQLSDAELAINKLDHEFTQIYNQTLYNQTSNWGTREEVDGWEWGYIRRQLNERRHSAILEHDKAVLCLSVFNNGKSVIYAGVDGKLVVAQCDDDSWTQHSFGFEAAGITDIALSRDGQLVIGTSSGYLHIRSINDGSKDVGPFDLGEPVTRVAFSPNAKFVIAATEAPDTQQGTLRIFHTQSGTPQPNDTDDTPHAKPIYGLVVGGQIDDQLTIVSGCGSGTMKQWSFDQRTGELKMEQEESVGDAGISAIALDPQERSFAVARFDGTIQLYQRGLGSSPNYSRAQAIRHPGRVYAIAYDPSGTQIISAGEDATTGEDATIRLWDVFDGTQLPARWGHTAPINAVAFLAPTFANSSDNQSGNIGFRDGQWIVSAGEDSTVRFWGHLEPPSRRLIDPGSSRSPITSLVFSDDNARIYCVKDQNRILAWDLSDSSQGPDVLESDAERITSIRVDPGSGQLAAIDQRKRVLIWVSVNSLPTELRTDLPEINAVSIAYRPDGRGLAVLSENGQLHTFNTTTFEKQNSFPLRDFKAVDLVSTQDSLWVLGADGSLRAIVENRADPDTLTRIPSWSSSPMAPYACSPDGKRVVTSEGGALHLWGALTGSPILDLSVGDYAVRSVAFSPNGTMIASGDDHGEIRIWSSESQ